MAKGDAFTATFDGAGIYPFACQYHPGMTGAIVVGDGKGAGSGAGITVEPFSAPDPETVTRVGGQDGGTPGRVGSSRPVSSGWRSAPGSRSASLRSGSKRTAA